MGTRPFPLVSFLVVSVLFLPAVSAGAHTAHTQPEFTTAATCTVTSKDDSGPGTLRDCLSTAVSGDTITFDPAVFPPANPVVIALVNALPDVSQGNLTIDASNAGVILNGSSTPPWTRGLVISSNSNRVMGLQILNFPGCGLLINQAQRNTIGGDRTTGHGPMGQGNLISGNGDRGIIIDGTGAMSNTVSGNYIGTDVSGTRGLGNAWMGVDIRGGAQANTVGGRTAGERNIISSNGFVGVGIWDAGTDNNVVTGNYIGTDVNGTAELGNESAGVRLGHGPEHNFVGGATPEERNIISGNGQDGVEIGGAHNNLIIGNYIGTDVSGMVALGNAERGIGINEAGQGLATTRNVIERNLISGNGTSGVDIYGADTVSNTLRGNLIGTDAAGTGMLGNGGRGIWFGGSAHHNTIGGSTAQDRNVISSNSWGVWIGGAGTANNTVTGNFIGTDISGVAALGNTNAGVVFYGGAQRNTIGPNNAIAYNGTDGVIVYGSTCLSNTITGNSIHSNTNKGIELAAGGNQELFPPILTDVSANLVAGLVPLNSTVEIFSDADDEGRIYEGSTTADGFGHFSFSKSGGFSLANVTATATDAAGNTSEFSAEAPRVPPTITRVAPNQGNNDVPSEINILGSYFSSGITVTLGTVPPVSLTVRFGDSSQIVAVVPPGLSPGQYDLTVVNPGGGRATLQGAYEVYGAASDDLFGYPYEFWTDPPVLRTEEPGGLGLVVHRQGGNNALANVVVRFYRGNPSQGGTVIGDGVIPLLSPNTSLSTPRVRWTPPGSGMYDLYAVIDPGDAISETTKTNNVISRTVTVLGPAPDLVAPHVDSFAINDGASLATSPNVTLDATASDNPGGSGVASLLYLEFEYSQAANQWFPVQSSGWVTYTTAQSNYPWKLLPSAGMKYLQAWAADKAGNISLYPYRTYINYVPAAYHVARGQVRIYRYGLAAGQVLTVTVTPISGDPDLYVWPPDFPTRPPWVSNLASGVDEVSFSAPVAGVYQIEVYGYTAADYRIAGTGPAVGHANSRSQQTSTSKPERAAPALPVNSEPGVQIALPAPTVPEHRIYLPIVLK